MKIPFKQTDGGKLAAGFNKEKRDCTVRAIALSGGIPYSEAHEYMRRGGRPNGKGGMPENGLKLAYQDGKLDYNQRFDLTKSVKLTGRIDTCGYMKVQHPTLAAVYSKLDKSKRYLVYTRRHAFAIINGTIHDTFASGLRSRIQCVIEVTPKPQSQMEAQKPSQSQINDLWARVTKLEERLS